MVAVKDDVEMYMFLLTFRVEISVTTLEARRNAIMMTQKAPVNIISEEAMILAMVSIPDTLACLITDFDPILYLEKANVSCKTTIDL